MFYARFGDIGMEQAGLYLDLSDDRKNKLIAASRNLSMTMLCKEVIGSGSRPIDYIGPLPEDEGAGSHAGF
jgi:hypothetical protein